MNGARAATARRAPENLISKSTLYGLTLHEIPYLSLLRGLVHYGCCDAFWMRCWKQFIGKCSVAHARIDTNTDFNNTNTNPGTNFYFYSYSYFYFYSYFYSYSNINSCHDVSTKWKINIHR